MNQVIRVFETAALTVAEALAGFLASCKARNLSQETVNYYRHRLTAFRNFLESKEPTPAATEVTPSDIREFLTVELERNSPTTASHSHCALSAFYRHLEREGCVKVNPMERVEKPKRRKVIIQTVTAAQVEALLRTCGRDFYGVRDKALLLTLLDSGLRASELCGLKLDDVNLEEQTALVLGKGDKERIVPFGASVKAALVSYLNRRGDDHGPMFVNHYGDTLTRYGLRDMVIRRGQEADIKGVRMSLHTLRHTFAVSYLRNGGDVFSLQKLLGHSDLTMTRRYAELSEQDVLEKHRRFSPMDGLKPKSKSGRQRLR